MRAVPSLIYLSLKLLYVQTLNRINNLLSFQRKKTMILFVFLFRGESCSRTVPTHRWKNIRGSALKLHHRHFWTHWIRSRDLHKTALLVWGGSRTFLLHFKWCCVCVETQKSSLRCLCMQIYTSVFRVNDLGKTWMYFNPGGFSFQNEGKGAGE